MDTPQEVQVWYVLPALRRQLAQELKKNRMLQKDIASSLGITEAAVSQYLKKKRGEDILFGHVVKKEIALSAKNIMADKKKAKVELQRLLAKIKETKEMCCICQKHIGSEKDCEICYT